MREIFTYGSVGGASGNRCFYPEAAASLYCGIGILCGFVFASHSGLLILDIVDRFINNFGVLAGGLVEIIFLAWICGLEGFKENINLTSDFKVGNLWVFCLKIITPAVLGYMSISNLIGDIKTPDGGYPSLALFVFGWCIVGGIIVLSIIINFTVQGGEK